ncbi:hypothetical protein pb186bvf_013446 [Paramecium bursaria]
MQDDNQLLLKDPQLLLNQLEKSQKYQKGHISLFEQIISLIKKDNTETSLIYSKILRILSRSQELVLNLNIEIFGEICQIAKNIINKSDDLSIAIFVELITIQKRMLHFRIDFFNIYDKTQITYILDGLGNIKVQWFILDYIISLSELSIKQELVTQLSQLYYLGQLLLIYESKNDEIRLSLTNLLTNFIQIPQFNQQFKKIAGIQTIFDEYKKQENQIHKIKIPLLNLILQICEIRDNLVDLRIYDVIELLLASIEWDHYIICTTIINIFTQLCYDEEYLNKLIDVCINQFLQLLFTISEKKCKFVDISEKEQDIAIKELQLYLFRFMRYVASTSKSRAIFKQIFIPRLLQIFIDIGNFVRSIQSYKKIVEEYRKIEKHDIEYMKESRQIYLDNLISGKQYREYTIIEQVGKGAFGSVYLCKHGNSRYALKQINEVETIEHREVQIHQQIDHPNIVKFHKCFVEDKTLCLILEYVEGFNLSELIKLKQESGQKFEEEKIWKIIIDLMSALRYLHIDKKIVHRDLNPANVMVKSDYTIKLCDFGLAKEIQEDVINKSFVGTLIYTCPEIVENKQYTEKADIWSFGCILYELLKLKPAFSSNNPLTLASKIVQLEFEPLDNINYSFELIQFVEQCLQKDEEKRPSIDQLLDKISIRLSNQLDWYKFENDQLKNQMAARNNQNINQEDDPLVWKIFQQILQIFQNPAPEKYRDQYQQLSYYYVRILLKLPYDLMFKELSNYKDSQNQHMRIYISQSNNQMIDIYYDKIMINLCVIKL